MKQPQIKPYKGPRLEFPSEYPGEMIHVAKREYDGITKKVNITGVRSIGGAGGKILIEYSSKKFGGHGVLELYDIGPLPTKP